MRNKLLALASVLIISSPAWVYLLKLDDFGRLQNNDYYGIIRLMADGDSLSSDPIRWLKLKSNEHRATLPMVVYALNMKLTDGHNLGLTLYALAMLTGMLTLLYFLLPADVRGSPGPRILLGLLLGLLCYTPVAAHSVAMGFSGTQWFSSNLLAVAAIAALVWRADQSRVGALWPVLLFGFLGAFTYSTSLLLWPALLAGALYLKAGLRRCLLIAAGATAVYALFVFSYQPLSYHPEPETRDWRMLIAYTGVFLGSLFTSNVAIAKLVGWIGILASLAVQTTAALTFRSARHHHAPWLMIQIYAFGNALGTAISRSGFGEAQSMESRYASIAALFWLGGVIPLGILAWRLLPTLPAGRIAMPIALALLTAGVAIPMHERGGKVVDRFAARGSRQGVAALAIRHGLQDNEVLGASVTPAPHQVWAIRDFMAATGHVPFDRNPDLRLGEPVDRTRLSAQLPTSLQGTVDRLVKISPTVVRLQGWAYSSEAPLEEVILLDSSGKIRGEVVLGIHRRDVKRTLPAVALDAGWEGYALDPDAHGEIPSAYVRLRNDPTFYKLPMIPSVQRQVGGG